MRTLIPMFRAVCSLGLLITFQLNAAPSFHSARWADGTEVDSLEIGNRIPLILVHGIREDSHVWDSFLIQFLEVSLDRPE